MSGHLFLFGPKNGFLRALSHTCRRLTRPEEWNDLGPQLFREACLITRVQQDIQIYTYTPYCGTPNYQWCLPFEATPPNRQAAVERRRYPPHSTCSTQSNPLPSYCIETWGGGVTKQQPSLGMPPTRILRKAPQLPQLSYIVTRAM